MNNLPQRYTALVARRPELDIPSFGRTFDPAEMASAMIFRRLCEAMPHAHALVRMFDKWAIATVIVGSSSETSDWHPDPLSALFAFWEAQ